jgi:hypothetical protein
MTDQGPLASKWAASARAFDDGAGDAVDSLFAVDCVWNSPQGQIAGSAVIQAAINEMRQALGWQSHELVGSSEADGLLALPRRNTYASGATVHVAAGVKFVGGKVTEIHSVGGLPEVTA